MVRILENKVELVKENLSYDEVLCKIEQATRLCYRSKRSETREGREKFLKNLILYTTIIPCLSTINKHKYAILYILIYNI